MKGEDFEDTINGLIEELMNEVARAVIGILEDMPGGLEFIGLAAIRSFIDCRIEMMSEEEREVFDKFMENTTTIALPRILTKEEDE